MPAHTPLTHFLALPLYTSRSARSLQAAAARLEAAAAASSGPADAATTAPVPQHEQAHHARAGDSSSALRKIPVDAVRPPSTLHLTLGVMSLGGRERLQAAVEFLRALDLPSMLAAADSGAAAQNPGSTLPLLVSLRGLHPMQSPQSTNVLYSSPHDNSGRLRPLCEALRAEFEKAGFVQRENRELKLHATMVRAVYGGGGAQRGRGGRGGRGVRPPPPKIDGTELIEQFKDEVWADIIVDKVVICEMGAKEDANGIVRYRVVAETSLV